MDLSKSKRTSRKRKRLASGVISEDSLTLIQAGFDHMDEGISMYDSELRLVAWNRAFVELLEFPDDFLQVGRPIADFIKFNADRGAYGEGDEESLLSGRLALIEKGERQTFDRVRADGEVVEVDWFPLPDGGLVITYRDVTDRRQAAEARNQADDAVRGLNQDLQIQLDLLSKREQELANAQRIAHVGSWEWDIPAGRVDWSDECFRIFGLEPGQIDTSFETIMRLLDPEDAERLATVFQNTIDTGERYTNEHKVIRPDGTIAYVIGRGEVAERAPDGQATRLSGTVLDITERKQAEDAVRDLNEDLRNQLKLLSRRERELANAQRITHIGSWEWEVATGRVEWSDENFRIFGFEPGGFETTFDAVIPLLEPEGAERVNAAIQNTIETGEPYVVEYRIEHQDGTMIDLIGRAEVLERAPNGKVISLTGTVQDITERKKLRKR